VIQNFNWDAARAAAAGAADEKSMVLCRSLIDGLSDNGHKYAKGETLHMHRDLVPVHMQHGQVEIVVAADNKQATPPKTK